MISLCDNCVYRRSDCKGSKSVEKLTCNYYKKQAVFNAREAAEKLATLSKRVEELEEEYYRLQEKYVQLKDRSDKLLNDAYAAGHNDALNEVIALAKEGIK